MIHQRAVVATVVVCVFAYSAVAISVEVKYDYPSLSIRAENETLQSVLLNLTEYTGGKIIGSPSELQKRISFNGESKNPKSILWKLLRNFNSAITWSDDGKYIKEIRVIGEGDSNVANSAQLMSADISHLGLPPSVPPNNAFEIIDESDLEPLTEEEKAMAAEIDAELSTHSIDSEIEDGKAIEGNYLLEDIIE